MKGGAGAAAVFLFSLVTVGLVLFAPARWLALPMLGMAAGLFLSRKSTSWLEIIAPTLLACLAALVFLSDSKQGALAYPVVINLGLFAYFSNSLRSGQTAIETLARLEQPVLPPEGVRYTRTLTKVWCGFFLINGGVAAITAWVGDARMWALYNGLISYALIGLLIAGERMLRPKLMRMSSVGPTSFESQAKRLMGEGRPEDAIVCYRMEGPVELGKFRSDVMGKARSISDNPAAEWIIGAQDGYQFAVDLLAVVLSGRHALVPQNHRPDTLAGMRSRHPQAVLCEAASRTPGFSEWKPSEFGTVSFLTSGSTGEPKAATRSFGALLAEAEAIEGLFGEEVGSAQVIGTVPHHFIYGAIFRIIWPLWSGRAFHAEPLSDVGAVLARLRGEGDFALVSSPSFLERVPVAEIVGLKALRTVFSSGSPLRSEVAARWSSPLEIYGSTETGGIAWRRQFRGGEDWQAMPGVKLASDRSGQLQVESPFLAAGGGLTSDLVKMRDGSRFELVGRSDGIVKVEGRRVSLAELETAVCSHPHVSACRLVQIESGGRLGAIVVPKVDLPSLDYSVLTHDLRSMLLKTQDAVVVPRRWKFLPRIPSDQRGKVSQSELRDVFSPSSGVHSSMSGWPQLLGHARNSQDEVAISFKVSPELPIFEGHFPGMPILPGIALVDWAALLSEAYLEAPFSYHEVDSLKFNAAVYPGETLELSLLSLPNGIRFKFSVPAGLKASGALYRRN